MKDVRLTKLDSCLTYAIKRAGLDQDVDFKVALDIPPSMYMPFKISEVYVGQIVVWESKKSHYLWTTEITTLENGRPALIANSEYAALHFGVVEHIVYGSFGNIITISDCIRNGNAHSFPTISLATICLTEEPLGKTEVRIPTYYLDV